MSADRAHREHLALRSVELAKALVLADNHFLSAAVGRLKPIPMQLKAPFATDGGVLAFDSEKVLEGYKETKTAPKHDVLHSVLHCVFLHPYAAQDMDQRLWDLACDIAVERLVVEVCGPRDGLRGQQIAEELDSIQEDCGGRPSSRKLYKRLLQGDWDGKLSYWERLFVSDDHTLWRSLPEEISVMVTPAEQSGPACSNQTAGQTDRAANMEAWRKIAKSLTTNLQTMSKKRGSELGGLMRDLDESNHERVDYRNFLRQFAIPVEVMRASDAEFDYIYYTYGMSLYSNLPLIEPLEYRDDKRIREFVIVIDMSGSVWQADVLRFIDMTFDVLKSTETFDEKVHVRILQCDAQVRSDSVITNMDDLREWGNTMRAYGGGGTDFRPAFEYVDSLVENGVFENLGGLVYFTDGWGTYPEWMPSYKTAFVFYDENYRPENVPPWALQMVLDSDDLAGAPRALQINEIR